MKEPLIGIHAGVIPAEQSCDREGMAQAVQMRLAYARWHVRIHLQYQVVECLADRLSTHWLAHWEKAERKYRIIRLPWPIPINAKL